MKLLLAGSYALVFVAKYIKMSNHEKVLF